MLQDQSLVFDKIISTSEALSTRKAGKAICCCFFFFLVTVGKQSPYYILSVLAGGSDQEAG